MHSENLFMSSAARQRPLSLHSCAHGCWKSDGDDGFVWQKHLQSSDIRPCPTCMEKGIRYSRSGQSLDEIVFKKNPKGGYYGDDAVE